MINLTVGGRQLSRETVQKRGPQGHSAGHVDKEDEALHNLIQLDFS